MSAWKLAGAAGFRRRRFGAGTATARFGLLRLMGGLTTADLATRLFGFDTLACGARFFAGAFRLKALSTALGFPPTGAFLARFLVSFSARLACFRFAFAALTAFLAAKTTAFASLMAPIRLDESEMGFFTRTIP